MTTYSFLVQIDGDDMDEGFDAQRYADEILNIVCKVAKTQEKMCLVDAEVKYLGEN
jgi:hypothetical protein